MSLVVGVDPSLTSAGVAILKDGQPVHVSHHGFSGEKRPSWQFRSRRIRYVCSKVMATMTERPDLVVIEGLPEHGRILPSTLDRAGLWHGLYAALDHRDLPVAVMNPKTLKKWVTGAEAEEDGNGNADKRDIIAAVGKWWPGVAKGDDEHDALALAATGALHLGDPLPFEVKERHHTALEKTLWPVIA